VLNFSQRMQSSGTRPYSATNRRWLWRPTLRQISGAETDRSFHLALKTNESVKDANRIDTAAILNNLANVMFSKGP
jgi:hypothetical protein